MFKKEKIIAELKMRMMEIERNNSTSIRNNFGVKTKNKVFQSNYEDCETDIVHYNNSENNIEEKSWNEYLKSKDESCVICKESNRKILKYQLELECLRQIRNNKENVELSDFMKSNKKLNENNGNNLDLLIHCYNQAKLIENFDIA